MITNKPRAADSEANRLKSAIADLYRGPLNEFVSRRDALAKELRSAGDRESASIVKQLRKPSRAAWALDLAAVESPDALETLVEVVAELLDAQNRDVDVRSAIARLQAAVREFASRAAHFAAQAGQPVETGTLANAVLAVLGQPDSFSQLRRGTLADIPEAGGLDLLAALPAATAQVPQARAAHATPAPLEGSELESAAGDQAQQAAVALADARARWEESQRTLREAESQLGAAEQRLREAEAAAREARSQRDRAREAAETVAAELSRAERRHHRT